MGDRMDAATPRNVPRDHHPFGAGIEDEVLVAAAIHLRAYQDLVAVDTNRDAPDVRGIARAEVEWLTAVERFQETNLGTCPGRLFTDVAVGKEVDVVAEGQRRLLEPVHLCVDGGDRVVEISLPRVQPQCLLRFRNGLVETVACCQPARAAVASARLPVVGRSRHAIGGFGGIEQSIRPKRVSVDCGDIRRFWKSRSQRRRGVVGGIELPHPQRRDDQPDTCAAAERIRRQRPPICVGGLSVPSLAQQEIAQLRLDVGLGERRLLSNQQSGRNQPYREGCERASHEASSLQLPAAS